MRDLLILTIHLIVSNRVRLRAPNLTTLDRFLIGLTALFIDPRRIPKCAGLFQSAPFFKFHRIRVDRKYRLLFSRSVEADNYETNWPTNLKLSTNM